MPVLDITVEDFSDIIHFPSKDLFDDEDECKFESLLTTAVLPEDFKVRILRCGYFVRIHEQDGNKNVFVELNMPDGGCYSCSQCFILKDGFFE